MLVSVLMTQSCTVPLNDVIHGTGAQSAPDFNTRVHIWNSGAIGTVFTYGAGALSAPDFKLCWYIFWKIIPAAYVKWNYVEYSLKSGAESAPDFFTHMASIRRHKKNVTPFAHINLDSMKLNVWMRGKWGRSIFIKRGEVNYKSQYNYIH